MEELQRIYGEDIQDKTYQSIQCGRDKATVYFYQYETEADVIDALPSLKTLIWGGNSPSRMHPELFVVIRNTLAVVSSKKPKKFVDIVDGRVPGG